MQGTLDWRHWMSQDGKQPDPNARTKFLTRLIKRGRAALAAPPVAPEPAAPAAQADADRTQLMDQPEPPAPPAHPSTIRGGAKPSTKGTMFGQMYSPYAITQEVVKKPGPPPK